MDKEKSWKLHVKNAVGESEVICICSGCEKDEPECDNCERIFEIGDEFLCDGAEYHYCDKKCRDEHFKKAERED